MILLTLIGSLMIKFYLLAEMSRVMKVFFVMRMLLGMMVLFGLKALFHSHKCETD